MRGSTGRLLCAGVSLAAVGIVTSAQAVERNVPSQYAWIQQVVSASSDGVGVGDVCDSCPATWNPDQADMDEDASGDAFDQRVNVIADSVLDFSGVQGENGWYYGFYDRTADPGGTYHPSKLQLMTQFLTGPSLNYESWYVPGWYVEDGTYWTALVATGGFPNGLSGFAGRLAREHWTIRRWISSTSGPVTVIGVLSKQPGTCGGTGFVGGILVDGLQLYSQYIDGCDCTGANYSIVPVIAIGSTIDFIIDPYQANDLADHVRFTATIIAPPRDTDGDTVPDQDDNCPAVANTNQEDADADGVGNVCDNCPTVANADQADGDADGVGNACDECPSTPPHTWVRANGCVPGDFNHDNDVDLADFSQFQACFNGPNNPPAEGCLVDADMDGDGDVGLSDYAVFAHCFNGPNRPPACVRQ